ncbi:multicopper oxidase, types 2 and 3 [Cystobacter fuscus DSM 2262]|uniref:Multicopper oxidase, types 2 and 3 n=1 Tax=Cystobacter fuscus (strain ATCC 25194 / DSM 2262 / NBRC 100088 / M29) TaxID=1242864 RepID=S9PET0_CYSF2|nr:multicopper oxidase family protein [Cystobacter fuscus]EPX60872.1 multicopper oxidase, types 2 and 3 [Cystobacter fuscus DSM 2262]
MEKTNAGHGMHPEHPHQHPHEHPRPHEHSGEVDVRLEVKYAINKIPSVLVDGQAQGIDTVRLRSYNGKLVGPTIEARPGDTLNILLDNQLPMTHAPGAGHEDMSQDINTTNLHVHGLHVSPAGNADNVMLELVPGQQLQYEIKIPRDHPAGTYWYHPHKHGSVAIQVSNGLSGALIIRGDIDEVPAIKAAREKIFVIQQIPYVINDQTKLGQVEPGDTVNGHNVFFPGNWENMKRRFTINGEVEPTLQLRPGEVQRWRFIHAGFRNNLQLKLVRRDPKTGAEEFLPQYLIALDGITTGSIDPLEAVELHPAYRADVLVRATDNQGKALPEGIYWLVDGTQDAQAESRKLARIVVKGPRVMMKLPTDKELAPLAPFKDVQDGEITGQQKAVFELRIDSEPAVGLINGKTFNHMDPPRKLLLGAVEEWEVSSPQHPGDTRYADEGHPFHIHLNPFQCTLKLKGVGGEKEKRVWKDTIFVESGQTMKLRTRYERYVGMFMVHCHILDHEDFGMMETMEIVLPGGMDMHMPDGGGGHGGHVH